MQSHLDKLQVAEGGRRLLHHSQVLDIAIDHLRSIGQVENTTQSK